MKKPTLTIVYRTVEAGRVWEHTLTLWFGGRLPFGFVRHRAKHVGELPGESMVQNMRDALAAATAKLAREVDAEYMQSRHAPNGREVIDQLDREANARLVFDRLVDTDPWWGREERALREAAEKARREP